MSDHYVGPHRHTLTDCRRLVAEAYGIDPLALTLREEEVVRQATEGRHNHEIAASLGVSEQTVKNHLYAAGLRNQMNRVQLIVAFVMHPQTMRPARDRRERVRVARTVVLAGPATACPHCAMRRLLDDGYHEIPDPSALGGKRWVPCSAEEAAS